MISPGICGCADKEAEILLEEEQEELSSQTDETVDQEQENDSGSRKEAVTEKPDPEPTQPPEEIYVDVCGAVTQPGVYAMKSDSRVFQAIEAAGGFLPEAAGTAINQACALSDGQQIYVPTKEEAEKGKAGQPSGGAASPGYRRSSDGSCRNRGNAGVRNSKPEHGRFCSASDIARYR